jgi:hypothetical protein
MIDTLATTPCACESRGNPSAPNVRALASAAAAVSLRKSVPARSSAASAGSNRSAGVSCIKQTSGSSVPNDSARALPPPKRHGTRSALASSAPTATVNTPRPTSDKNSRRVPGKVIKSSRFLFRLLSSYYADCRAGQCHSVALITRQVEFSHRLRAPAFHV